MPIFFSQQRTPVTALALAGALALATTCARHTSSTPQPLPSRDGSAAADVAASDALAAKDVSVDPPDGPLSPPPDPPAPPAPPTTTAVLTFRNDNFRTGAQLLERQL